MRTTLAAMFLFACLTAVQGFGADVDERALSSVLREALLEFCTSTEHARFAKFRAKTGLLSVVQRHEFHGDAMLYFTLRDSMEQLEFPYRRASCNLKADIAIFVESIDGKCFWLIWQK